MTLFRALSAVVISFSALSMGCSDGAGDLDMAGAPAMDDPFYSSMAGPNGSTGTNNLAPADFHANKANLLGATRSALATYGSADHMWWLAGNASNNALLGTTGGRNVMKYAVRCALQSTSSVSTQLGASILTYPGQGLLSPTSAWKTTALNPDQADSLFTCLIAHLNANGVEVPINLSGPQINNVVGSDTSFTWEEALWAVKVIEDDDGGVDFRLYVWPFQSLVECSGHVSGLADRVCGIGMGSCGLTVRTDRDSACTEQIDGWYCNDTSGHPLPAIKTRLKAKDVKKIYADCP